MVVVSIKGGLGNQMFQYATARGITKNGRVFIDPIFIQNNSQSSENFTARRINLYLFPNLKARLVSPLLQKALHKPSFWCNNFRRIMRFRYYKQLENEFIREKHPIYLDGYYQSEKYFKDVRNQLLNEFAFPKLDDALNEAMALQIQSCNQAVSLHVRRGDYLKPGILKYHGVLPIDYYKKAIEVIETTVKAPAYFVFSDDPEWSKVNLSFLGSKAVFVDHNISSSSAWKDMYLMTLCKHHIVANSSFSWWGAWLSKNDEGVKIAPCKWFNPEVANFQIEDFIPQTWEII
jgi:hypothetical protein